MEPSDKAELKWSGAGRAIIQVSTILSSAQFYLNDVMCSDGI